MGVDVHDSERTWTVRGARRLTPPASRGMPAPTQAMGGYAAYGHYPPPRYGADYSAYSAYPGYPPAAGYGYGAYGAGYDAYAGGTAPRPGDDYTDYNRRRDGERGERDRSRER